MIDNPKYIKDQQVKAQLWRQEEEFKKKQDIMKKVKIGPKMFLDFDEIQKKTQFTAELEFCSKGIDPSKFILYPSSRYFNIILVIKTVLIEAVLISTQSITAIQVTFLLIIQGAFFVFFLKSLFQYKIFKHKLLSYMNLIFESALMAFIIMCLLEGWCKLGLSFTCTYVVTRRVTLFSLIGIIFGVLCFYLITMVTSLFTRMYLPDKVKEENKIQLPEDRVEIIWIDDSEILNKRGKI